MTRRFSSHEYVNQLNSLNIMMPDPFTGEAIREPRFIVLLDRNTTAHAFVLDKSTIEKLLNYGLLEKYGISSSSASDINTHSQIYHLAKACIDEQNKEITLSIISKQQFQQLSEVDKLSYVWFTENYALNLSKLDDIYYEVISQSFPLPMCVVNTNDGHSSRFQDAVRSINAAHGRSLYTNLSIATDRMTFYPDTVHKKIIDYLIQLSTEAVKSNQTSITFTMKQVFTNWQQLVNKAFVQDAKMFDSIQFLKPYSYGLNIFIFLNFISLLQKIDFNINMMAQEYHLSHNERLLTSYFFYLPASLIQMIYLCELSQRRIFFSPTLREKYFPLISGFCDVAMLLSFLSLSLSSSMVVMYSYVSQPVLFPLFLMGHVVSALTQLISLMPMYTLMGCFLKELFTFIFNIPNFLNSFINARRDQQDGWFTQVKIFSVLMMLNQVKNYYNLNYVPQLKIGDSLLFSYRTGFMLAAANFVSNNLFDLIGSYYLIRSMAAQRAVLTDYNGSVDVYSVSNAQVDRYPLLPLKRMIDFSLPVLFMRLAYAVYMTLISLQADYSVPMAVVLFISYFIETTRYDLMRESANIYSHQFSIPTLFIVNDGLINEFKQAEQQAQNSR